MSDSCFDTMSLVYAAQAIAEREGISFPQAVDRLLGPMRIPIEFKTADIDQTDARTERKTHDRS